MASPVNTQAQLAVCGVEMLRIRLLTSISRIFGRFSLSARLR
jgi:hypothetical protein